MMPTARILTLSSLAAALSLPLLSADAFAHGGAPHRHRHQRATAPSFRMTDVSTSPTSAPLIIGAVGGSGTRVVARIAPGQAQSYGKAAIVGEAGELEHAAAILHPKLGAPLRSAVEKGAALVPSSKKRGGLGTAIDVPLGHKDAAFVRSHFDAMEIRVGDAPRRDEIVVAVVVTDSGRPLARIGGLAAHEIEGKDGLR